MSKRVMLVFGTRPEAVKLCPLVNELKSRKTFDVRVCLSGQHREMLDSVLCELGVRADCNLEIMRSAQTLTHVTTRTLEGICGILERERPDTVIVHGDTTTAFAASLACFYQRIPVAHVEAGLRTGDIEAPFPEEFNRRAVALTARLHFAPTEGARENLLCEGVPLSKIFVTGNTVIDAVKQTVRDGYTHPFLEAARGKRVIFLTAHRRESIGAPLEAMLRAVRRIANTYADISVIYPVHLNPAVRDTARRILGDTERVTLCEPLGVKDCHNIIARSYLVLTDSGGIQEEAAALHKPVLIMRGVTERPEGINAGIARLTGTDEESIFSHTCRLLCDREAYTHMTRSLNPYGDGNACARIADILEREGD